MNWRIKIKLKVGRILSYRIRFYRPQKNCMSRLIRITGIVASSMAVDQVFGCSEWNLQDVRASMYGII